MEGLACALCSGLPLSNQYYVGKKDEIRKEKMVWGKANRLKRDKGDYAGL